MHQIQLYGHYVKVRISMHYNEYLNTYKQKKELGYGKNNVYDEIQGHT